MGEPLETQEIGAVTVLYGERGGKYPHGNTLLVARRARRRSLIDPSLGLCRARAARPRVDRVLNSHCHEDHVAGNHLYPEVPWHLHEADLPGIASLDALMEIYGYPRADRRGLFAQRRWSSASTSRRAPDALGFRDGDVFELGGGVRVRVIHAPGHTRGHCFFHVQPDDVLYLADIDLSSFGPYYGDAWSELEDFERTLARARDIDARYYATFHHIGVIDGRAAFLERLDRFAAVIADREARLLAYLAEPRSLDEIAEHRFVYRPQDPVPFADAVERRSMSQHLARLVRGGRVREVEPGHYLRSDA